MTSVTEMTRHAGPRSWLRWLAAEGWRQGLCLLTITTLVLVGGIRTFERAIPSVDFGWAIYWPYDGIVAAVLLMLPRRRWLWIIGGFVLAFSWVEGIRSNTPGETAVDVACNSIEVLIIAFALPAFHNLNAWLTEPRLLWRFTGSAIVGAPALTGLPIAWYYTHFYPVSFWSVTAKWAFADALGAALWLPLTLVLASRETYALFQWRRLPQTLGLLGALSAVAWATFQQQRYPLSFLPYPFLLFVALRLGFSGAVVGTNLLALIVTSLSVHGVGPFRSPGTWTGGQVIVLQLFSTLAVVFVFPLGVTLVERRNFEQQLRQAYADMKQLATIDQLTQVANRRHFDQVLQTEWSRAVRARAPLAMLMIDADYFKAYNDRYGHVAGDECLRQIAATLAAGVPRRQDLVARYGGEEFVVLLPGMQRYVVETFAEELRAAVQQLALPHAANPHGQVTVSIGCEITVPKLQAPIESFIEAADRALYIAKQRGRNCVQVAAMIEGDHGEV